jgi:hypothetical protein
VSLSTHLAGGWVIAASFWIWEREGSDAYHGNEPPAHICCGSSADMKFEVFTMSIRAIVHWMALCNMPEYSTIFPGL